MPDFHDDRLPETIEREAKGGPDFNTSVIVTGGGHEQRVKNWANPRRRYDIRYAISNRAEFDALLRFYIAREGMAHGFPFKDFADYVLPRQSIGTGDGVTAVFQAYKRYSSGGVDRDRDLTKLAAGTVQVWGNNVLQTEGVNYTVDYLTGEITFLAGSIPAGGHNVELACQFYVPVRFDTDIWQMSIRSGDLGTWEPVVLIELRE